jgi:hypothetical protein
MEGKILESWFMDDETNILHLHFEDNLHVEVRIVNLDYPESTLGVYVVEGTEL